MKSNNKTKYLILGLLQEGPLSGYEIKKVVDIRFKYFWSESYGQIYPELNKLCSSNSIIKIDGQIDPKKSERIKCKYQITDIGRKELLEWKKSPVEKEITRFELLLKLYFSDSSDTETMIKHIKEFQYNHLKQQEMFKLFQNDLENNIDLHDNHKEALMVLSFGQKIWKAYDEWCNETLKLLNERKEKENNGNKD